MKRIRVTVTEEYRIPDSWEIVNHPEDEILCLHGANKYFLPDLEWAERSVETLPGVFDSKPHAVWTSVRDDRGSWFIDRMETCDAQFEEIK